MRVIGVAFVLAAIALPPAVLPAQAQQRVPIGDKEAILHAPANPRASAVLVPGKGGIDPADPLHGFMGADREVVDGIARFVIR